MVIAGLIDEAPTAHLPTFLPLHLILYTMTVFYSLVIDAEARFLTAYRVAKSRGYSGARREEVHDYTGSG